MNTYRKNAIVVGILFIACTAASIAGPLLAGSNLNTLDYLIQLASNPNQTVFAVYLGCHRCGYRHWAVSRFKEIQPRACAGIGRFQGCGGCPGTGRHYQPAGINVTGTRIH
jgi:hypothetical protein